MKLTKWFSMLVVMLALTGFVMAETNDTNMDADNTTGQALNVRYDHLQCKVDFTNTQIEILNKYVPEIDQTANKDKLDTDMTELKVFLEAGDKDGFDNYVSETIKTDFNKATEDLTAVKKNFRQYNLSNESRTAAITEFKNAKESYSECVSEKEIKMAGVMEKHMEKWNEQLEKINENMNKKNITTADMIEIMNEIDARNAKLKELIEAGNITTLREFMKEYQNSQFHYMARFEISRLEGYKNKLGPLADKYNMSERIKDIDSQIANAQKCAKEGYKYTENEREQAWESIKDAREGIRETAKTINDERMEERKQQAQEKMNEREQKIEDRQLGKGPRNMPNDSNEDNDSGEDN